MHVDHQRSQSNLLAGCASLLIMLFPLGMASIKSWASGSTLLLFMMALLVVLRGDLREVYRGSRPLIYGASFFVLAILVSFAHADDLMYSTSRMVKLLPLVGAAILIYGFRALKGPFLESFIRGLVVAGPVMLVIAFHALWWRELPRAQGYYHPIVFAELSMIIALLLVCVLVCNVVSKWWSYGVCFSAVAAFGASMLAQSRGAWFAVPVIMLMLAFVFRQKLRPKGVLVGLSIPLVLMLMLPVLMPHSVGEQITRTYRSVESYVDGSQVNTSLGQRFLMWQVAVDVWSEHPLIGSGLGDFQIEAEKRIASGKTPLNKAWMHSHSIYFEALSTTGAVGFLSLLVAFFFIPIWLFYRRWKSSTESMEQFSALAGLTLVLCFATFGLSEAWTTRSPLINSYALMLSLFLAHVGVDGDEKGRSMETNL